MKTGEVYRLKLDFSSLGKSGNLFVVLSVFDHSSAACFCLVFLSENGIQIATFVKLGFADNLLTELYVEKLP